MHTQGGVFAVNSVDYLPPLFLLQLLSAHSIHTRHVVQIVN